MLSKIIISIIFIPITAIFFWAISNIGGERQSYKKALLATSLLFIVPFLANISFYWFHNSIVGNFIGGMYFRILLTCFVLWLIYRYDWTFLLIMSGTWVVSLFLIDMLQDKILTFDWNMILQAF